MSQIIHQTGSPVLVAITDRIGYVDARFQAEQLVKEHGLTLADMPLLIQSMNNQPKIRKAVRPVWVDTLTGEYHGQREGDRSYEAWHSVGSLATAEGLKRAFSKIGEYGFMPIPGAEWIAVGEGKFDGKNVVRVHFEDVKKGNVPIPGTPYCISVRLDKDNPTIHLRGQLDYDSFMRDDRVLMIAGSPDCREALAKILFGKKENGDEGWTSVGSYHRINDVDFSKKPKGCLAYLSGNYYGLNGYSNANYDGRFVGVGAGGAVGEKITPSIITQPTLEQTLAILNDPDLSKNAMEKAIRQMYKR
ncbi:MAG TPA: hypothetical protein VJI75_01875 [Candidatus Nanoarchaeia archaeon]|nr:hypothetical protein [Candidatus Nanoarchaeia archaeon]